MTLECLHCGDTCEQIGLVPMWKEYRVGGLQSDETFHFCPGCEKDQTVDPIRVWAKQASVHEVDTRTIV